jgi:putative FmdB family regulatory protein
MPIYEYVCNPCDRRFELLTTISKADQATCPKCGGSVKRLVSVFSARSSGGDSSSHSDSCAGCASGNCGSCGHH